MFAKLSAEFLGTFWLVLGGCGSAVLAAAFPGVGIGLLGVSLAFGLTVVTGAYALGPEAGEWLQQATLAIRAQVPLGVLDDVIQPFPTFSEVFLDALTELGAQVAGGAG